MSKRNDHWDEDEKNKVPNPLETMLDLELLKKNTLVLGGELEQDNCILIAKKLLYLELQGIKEIKIVLNSVGGEVFHGLLVYNTLEDLKKKGINIIVEARGICASMAAIIIQGASVRKTSKHTRFLLHEVETYVFGKVSQVHEQSIELDKVNSMLAEILVGRSKLTMKELKKKTKKKDWWLSAEEALELGLVDEIV